MDNVPTPIKRSPEDISASSRRRLLLSGLGKGAAVVAATVPIQTLAATVSLTPTGKGGIAGGFRCTVSGQMSGVHSKETTTPVCNGKSPGWWGQTDDGKTPRRTWPPGSNPIEVYSIKFPSPVLGNVPAVAQVSILGLGNYKPGVPAHAPSLFEVMNLPAYANTTTRHWIGAWLNGLSGANNFPYTGPEILAFYQLADGDTRKTNAYLLITNYLEML
jgi:hypothetical protein